MGSPEMVPQLEDLLAHAGWLRGLARSLVADSTRADDLSQETWLAALKNPPGSARHPRSWLARTLRNILHQELRSERSRGRVELGDVADAADSAELVQRVEIQRMLAAEVLRLPEPYRATLICRYYEGLSSAEIARRLGVPAGTVRWRLQAALNDLRTRLDNGSDEGRHAWTLALAPIAGLRRAAPGGSGATAAAATGALAMNLSTKAALTAAVAIALAGLGSLALLRKPKPEVSIAAPGTAHLEEALAGPVGEEDALASPQTDEGARTPAGAASVPRLRASGIVVDLPDPKVGGTPTPAVGVEVVGNTRSLSFAFDDESGHAETTTDGDGRFDLTLKDPGEVPDTYPLDLFISAKGDEKYRQGGGRFRFTDPSSITKLRVERAVHGDLVGETVGADGTPLPGVRVVIKPGNEQRVEGLSDEDGRFVFESFRGDSAPAVDARKPGWLLADLSPLRSRKEGGWDPLRIVLGQTGTLVVTTLDASGAPLEGAFVQADICPVEREARREVHGGVKREPVSASSDSTGRAILEPVWAGKKLQVSIVQSGVRKTWERAHEGQLLGSPEPSTGQAIVVPPAGRLELTASVQEPVRIRGRVVRADGSAVASARVEVRPLEQELRELYSCTDLVTDGEGRFDLAVAAPSSPHRLVILARDAVTATPSDLAVSRMLGVSGRSGDALDVELVLEPTLSISGRVLTTAGQPASGGIRALASPADFARMEEPLASGQAGLSDDGSFRLSGLRAGAYDLLFEPTEELLVGMRGFGMGTGLARQSFPGIEAGREDVELRLSDEKLVHVDVDAQPSSGTVSSMTVFIGKHHPLRPPNTLGRSPGRQASFSSLHGWPLGPTLLHGAGNAFARDEDGTMEIHYHFTFGSTYSLPALEEGWYWIGVLASDADNRAFFPAGTGCVYLQPGAYSFHFQVNPTADVEGRLVMATPDPGLCVALADQDGLLPLGSSGRNLDLAIEPGAAGDFLLEGVPVGSFSLRVGTAADLRAGRWRHEQALEVRSGENPVLRVDLP